MEIIGLWKKFITQSRSEMLNEIEGCILPSLAGEILYQVIDCEAWERVSIHEKLLSI